MLEKGVVEKKRALEDYWFSEAFTGRLVCRDMMMIPFFEMLYEAILTKNSSLLFYS
jgi:hypothetical protein